MEEQPDIPASPSLADSSGAAAAGDAPRQNPGVSVNTAIGMVRPAWPPMAASASALAVSERPRPYLIVESLLLQIGKTRAAELEAARTALCPATAGGWAVLYLPFLTGTSNGTPTWAGTWVATRGRNKTAETVSAPNPLALRDQIVGNSFHRIGTAV